MSAVCQWCGGTATSRVTVEPERTRRIKDPGTGAIEVYVARRAIIADVCDRHAEMVYRETDRTEKRRAMDRLRKSKKPLGDTQVFRLEKLEAELGAA